MTGREGSFHALNNRRYGTNVVAGVTPGKGGQDVEGVPVFDTFAMRSPSRGRTRRWSSSPPRSRPTRCSRPPMPASSSSMCITEGIPAHDMLRVYTHLRRTGATRLIGPNCPGVLSPGKANVGIIPAAFFSEGNVGVVSRSGTLTYQIGNELAQGGFGNSIDRRHRRRPDRRLLVHRRDRAVRGRSRRPS